MPKGDPAGYLPNVKRARAKAPAKKKGGKPAKTKIERKLAPPSY